MFTLGQLWGSMMADLSESGAIFCGKMIKMAILSWIQVL